MTLWVFGFSSLESFLRQLSETFFYLSGYYLVDEDDNYSKPLQNFLFQGLGDFHPFK